MLYTSPLRNSDRKSSLKNVRKSRANLYFAGKRIPLAMLHHVWWQCALEDPEGILRTMVCFKNSLEYEHCFAVLAYKPIMKGILSCMRAGRRVEHDLIASMCLGVDFHGAYCVPDSIRSPSTQRAFGLLLQLTGPHILLEGYYDQIRDWCAAHWRLYRTASPTLRSMVLHFMNYQCWSGFWDSRYVFSLD